MGKVDGRGLKERDSGSSSSAAAAAAQKHDQDYCKRRASLELAGCKSFFTVGSFHQRCRNFLQKPAMLFDSSVRHACYDDAWDGPARDEATNGVGSPASSDTIPHNP